MTEKQGKMKSYKKRFGVMAIEKGFITIDDLTRALEFQIQDEIRDKRHRLIGEVLLDEKMMSPEQIEEVVKAISIEYGVEMFKKALVVDNDFFFVEFLSELLENRGYEVTKAYDGKEGVSKIEEDLFDVIFVDLVMPKIDGIELIKFARKKFLQGYFPVVAVSGVLKMHADRIQEIGATYYIEKGPMEEMKDKIDGFLEGLEKEPFPDRMKDFSMETEGLDSIQPMVELFETLDFHRAIMDCIGVGMILIDKDARIINANPSALKILDTSFEKLVNHPIPEIFPAKEQSKVIRAFKQVAENRELRKVPLQITLNGLPIFLFISLLKIEDKASGWIIAMVDAGF